MNIGDRYKPVRLLADTEKIKYPEPQSFIIIELKEHTVVIELEDGTIKEQPYWFVNGYCKKEGV